MATHQSKAQKETVGRVMHEFKHGELEIGRGDKKVKNPKQAIAIALHEAGATNQESSSKNRKTLAHTKAKERSGKTAEAQKEGKSAQRRTLHSATHRAKSNHGHESTKGELYAEAQKRGIEGRSKMSKPELEKALAR